VTGNFDSLLGQFFTPITNQYVENVVTNSRLQQQVVRRVVGAPDVLFVVEDLGLVDNLYPNIFARSDADNWINNDALNGQSSLDGPGVVQLPIRFAFSNRLPYFLNQTPFYLDELYSSRSVVWGAFDGTTAPPIVFPNWWSIQALEEEILNPLPP